VKEQRADDSDGQRIHHRWLEVAKSLLIQEEEWDQNLDKENNEALFQSESLLQGRAAFGHVSTDRKVVDIACKAETLILLKVLFFDNDIRLALFGFNQKSIFTLTRARCT